MVFVLFLRKDELLGCDVDSKCDYGNAKAGHRVFEHGAVGENGVFAPCLAPCPRVSIQGSLGHDGAMRFG